MTVKHPRITGSVGKSIERNLVAFAHSEESAADMVVEEVDSRQDERYQPMAKSVAPHHPLVVFATRVPVRSIEAASGHSPQEPAKELFVTGVHAQRDVRLASVAAKMPFADQQAKYESSFEIVHAGSGHDVFLAR
jgi:hypothetical protein